MADFLSSPGVGLSRDRHGSGGLPRRFRLRSAAVAIVALLVSACVATQVPTAVEPDSPGFLLGVWHGFIFPVAWIVSLFTDQVSVYAVPNNGGWYDFGFFVGIVFIGVGARGSRIVYRDRVIVRDRGQTIDAEARRVD